MVSIDGRVALAIGKTIARAVSPFLALRAFGLPVFWSYQGRSITGSDAYHYQVGAGVALRIGRFDLMLEGIPFGEKAVAAAAGFAF